MDIFEYFKKNHGGQSYPGVTFTIAEVTKLDHSDTTLATFVYLKKTSQDMFMLYTLS